MRVEASRLNIQTGMVYAHGPIDDARPLEAFVGGSLVESVQEESKSASRPYTPIRRLGRTVFVGMAACLALEQYFDVPLVAAIGLLSALILPRFLFRRRIVIEWHSSDWLWTALAGLVSLVYSYFVFF